MSRHRRTDVRRPAGLRTLVVLAFLLSAGSAAMGVATAWPVDTCRPDAAPARVDTTPMPYAEPVAITMDRVDACSSLVPVGVDGARRIEVPSVHTPEQAGWYRLGPSPGEPGPAVVVGHVDGDGRRGVFAELAEAAAGDLITVGRRDGTRAVFTVTGVVQVAKDAFPTRAVYGDTRDAGLRLITCGGALDQAARSYDDNVIVFATLTGQG